jgi:hypothetical protein
MKKTLKFLTASVLAMLLVTLTAGSALAKVESQACWGNTCVSGTVEM